MIEHVRGSSVAVIPKRKMTSAVRRLTQRFTWITSLSDFTLCPRKMPIVMSMHTMEMVKPT